MNFFSSPWISFLDILRVILLCTVFYSAGRGLLEVFSFLNQLYSSLRRIRRWVDVRIAYHFLTTDDLFLFRLGGTGAFFLSIVIMETEYGRIGQPVGSGGRLWWSFIGFSLWAAARAFWRKRHPR